jgi:hypothetical protein
MEFSFGVITDGNNKNRIIDFIESIRRNSIPNNKYEIIIVGGEKIFGENIKHIPFDESQKKSWITRKKNIITENAEFENIVYCHDYIIFGRDWYNEFLKFGNDWDVCMNCIKNKNGERFRDWTLCSNFIPHLPVNLGVNLLLPYDVSNLTKYQYISGSYWVAKKYIMQKYKLDELLSWGQSEDIKWSKEIVDANAKYVMNKNSTVYINKEYKDPIFRTIDKSKIDILSKYNI